MLTERSQQALARSPYEWSEIELALTLLARQGGTAYKRVSNQLKDQGMVVEPRQIKQWKEVSFAPHYGEVLTRVRSELETASLDTSMEIATRAAEGESLLVDKTIERVDEMDARDLARSARELHMVKRSNVETARLLEGKPQSISEMRDPADLIDVLRKSGLFGEQAIEGEAEEIGQSTG